MPVYTLEESTYAGPIPDDTILAAEVTAIAEKKKPFTDKETGAEIWRVEFSFVVTEPESGWKDQRIWGDTATTFSTNTDCKLRNWASELLGVEELDSGFRLDTDLLVGQPCRIVVGARNYIKDGTDKTYNFVKDVIRAKAGVMAHQVPRAPVEEEPF